MKVEEYTEPSALNGSHIAGKKWKRRKLVLVFGVLALLLLGGAFSAGRLLGNDAQTMKSQTGDFFESEDGKMVGSAIQLRPDDRLPDEPPTATGLLHHRKDNSLFISQTPLTTGTVYLDQVDEWPIVEVVLTSDTQVYKDVSDFSAPKDGGMVQQVVAPGSIEEIDKGSSLFVWGELRGERLIAGVIQYW